MCEGEIIPGDFQLVAGLWCWTGGLLALISVQEEMLLCLHLLGGLAGVAGVITNQGMGWGSREDSQLEENEVREFTGWIKGRPEDYIMDLQRAQHRSKAQSNSRKTATSSLDLFSPGIQNDYESLLRKQSEIANLTYKKGEYRELLIRSENPRSDIWPGLDM